MFAAAQRGRYGQHRTRGCEPAQHDVGGRRSQLPDTRLQPVEGCDEPPHRLRSQASSREALLIALTGYGEAESRKRSVQAGFDFHMVKPADVNLLLTMLADPRAARRAVAA